MANSERIAVDFLRIITHLKANPQPITREQYDQISSLLGYRTTCVAYPNQKVVAVLLDNTTNKLNSTPVEDEGQ